jgi:plastocyanin
MHLRHFLAPAVGAIALIAVPAASACPRWGGGGYYQPMYGSGYYQPAPMYYPPAPTYYAPPTYYPTAPAPGMAPRAMPPVPTVPVQPTTATTVGAADNRFEPPTLNVAPGTTVRWTNTGKHPHTVTDRGGKFDSGDIAPGGTYSVTLSTPGTYRYYCKHHKGMEGTIVVGEPGKAPAGGTGGSGSSGPKY